MSDYKTEEVSASRLRIGVFFVFLWWAPFWALAPYIANIFASSEESTIGLTSIIVIIIMVIQTLIGLVGVFLCGKTVAAVIKQTHRLYRVLPIIFKILIKGKYEVKDNVPQDNKS